MSRLRARFPENSNESPNAHQYIKELEIVNNLMWDPQVNMEFAHENPFTALPLSNHVNYVGNYWVTRPAYPYGMFDMHLGTHDVTLTRAYVFDNHMQMYPGFQDWQMEYCCNDFKLYGGDQLMPDWAVSLPNSFVAPHISFTPQPSGISLIDSIYKTAGAFPRDPMDRRLMSSVCSGNIDPTVVNINPTATASNPGGDSFLMDPAAPSPVDTDGDGMPDAWEIAHGLNPNLADNNGTNLSTEGYTNLEVYLNERMNQLIAQDASISSQCAY
ncbi:MAG: hypothetical protein HQM15_11995 [Deltaproteobacteria bacterium]|nr:hypothetical protein [Deltaproteobacteria bacterium]